ncbi:hypothetical protein [Qipengyuania sediminis]|uniref:hypothetical protein n=1 Tax=Qipengyuania sediminis TaxID=1532023 RepID=UPI00105AAF46|nr:hypothetical protein [Qipengyuania sediminis]
MSTPRRSRFVPIFLFAEAMLIARVGLAIGHADDAPGAGLVGLLIGGALAFAAYRAARGAKAETTNPKRDQ